MTRALWRITLFLICVVVPILVHWQIAQVGLALTHSDMATALLTSDRIRAGHWSPFSFQMDYAGTTLTNFRALWCAIWEKVSTAPNADWTAQMAFSYLLTPVLFSTSVVVLLSAYCSRLATAIVGLVFAVGFQFMIAHWGNDAYFTYLCGGMLLLAWRARFENPWTQLTGRQFFWVGVACGILAYTSRISMIFILVFFLPIPYFWEQLKRLTRATDRVDRVLRDAGAALLVFFILLSSFGGELGTVGGKMVKLHADPNLAYFYLTQLLRYIRWGWAERKTEVFRLNLRRAAPLALGFGIGMIPEWIHRIHGLYRIHAPLRTYNFQGSATILGRVPLALKEIFGAGPTIAMTLSAWLVTAALIALGIRARVDRRFRPVAFSAILITAAFCRIYNYEFGYVPYLLPIIPAVALGMGALWDWAIRRRGAVVLAALGLLTAGHLYGQLRAHSTSARELRESGTIERGIEIASTFKEQGLHVVVTDDYWDSNQNSVFAHGDPLFVRDVVDALRHPRAIELAQSEKSVGFIFRRAKGPLTETQAYGRRFSLTFLKRVGEVDLYLGKAE